MQVQKEDEKMSATEFMKLIDGDIVVTRELIEAYFALAVKDRKNPKIDKVDYLLTQAKINYSFDSAHLMSERIHNVIDLVDYNHLYDMWLAEYPTKQKPEKPMVVSLCKSEVAALARMFNDGAYQVRLEASPTGIGVLVKATPMYARGFELEPGETKDITNYDNW